MLVPASRAWTQGWTKAKARSAANLSEKELKTRSRSTFEVLGSLNQISCAAEPERSLWSGADVSENFQDLFELKHRSDFPGVRQLSQQQARRDRTTRVASKAVDLDFSGYDRVQYLREVFGMVGGEYVLELLRQKCLEVGDQMRRKCCPSKGGAGLVNLIR